MEPEPVNPGVGSRPYPASDDKFKKAVSLSTIDPAKWR